MMGDRFPESWISTPLEGSEAFHDVYYFVQDFNTHSGKPVFKCLLCDIKGFLKSEVSCLEHARGRKHQRRYASLSRQQQIWLEEQALPKSFVQAMNAKEQENADLSYVMPFRRWQYNRWIRGECCRLCGTGEMSTRFDVVQHFGSKRHLILRNNSLWEEHADCQAIRKRVERLPFPYQYKMICVLYRYLGTKEASYAALASERCAYFRVMEALAMFELREKLALLECAIWKAAMLDGMGGAYSSLQGLEESMRSKGIDVLRFRRRSRQASNVTAILVGVIPFLRKYQASS